MYTNDPSCALSFLICKVAVFSCDEHVFIGQSHMSFFGFFQRLVILSADQKDHSLWERDC